MTLPRSLYIVEIPNRRDCISGWKSSVRHVGVNLETPPPSRILQAPQRVEWNGRMHDDTTASADAVGGHLTEDQRQALLISTGAVEFTGTLQKNLRRALDETKNLAILVGCEQALAEAFGPLTCGDPP